METTTVKYIGVPLTVHFIVDGKFIPATRIDPAEHAEYIIKEIYVEDSEIDIFNMLDWKEIEKIEELLYESTY